MKYNKKLQSFIVIILFQYFLMFLVIDLIFLANENVKEHMGTKLVISIVVLFAILSFYVLFQILVIIQKSKDNMDKLNSSEEIIDALRAQKHDFKNHLSVISGLLQLGNVDRAKNYIFDVNGRIDEAFSISKLENVEFAAILHTKMAIAESKGITVELDIDTSLNDVDINTVELCRIFFNLFDNAFYELDHCDEKEKILSVEIREFENDVILSVTNSYPLLSEEMQKKIFEKGFSTKESTEKRGYGLAIVKNLVQKNHGNVQVESYEDVGTIFSVFLPKSKEFIT